MDNLQQTIKSKSDQELQTDLLAEVWDDRETRLMVNELTARMKYNKLNLDQKSKLMDEIVELLNVIPEREYIINKIKELQS